MRCGRSYLAWLSGAAACVAPTVAAYSSSQPHERAIREAVEAEWNAAATFPDLESVSISWRVEDRTIGTAEEWARLNAEVPGHPDHPERWTFEIYKRRRAGDFLTDARTYRLQARNDGLWRLGCDLRPANLPAMELFEDRARAPKHAWTLTGESLKITGPDGGSQPGDHLDRSFRSAFYDVGHLLGGGIWLRAIHPFEADPVIVRGDRWEHRVYRLEGSERRYGLVREGRWDAALDRPVTEQGYSLVGPDLRARGTTVKYMEHHLDPVLGRVVARRVEHVDPDGSHSKVLVFLGAQREPPGSLEAATRVPQADREDAWRGITSFKMIMDERKGEALARPIHGPAVVQPSAADRGLRDWLQIAGWLIAGSLTVAFCALIIHRRASGRTP